jgi:hypothetical protein
MRRLFAFAAVFVPLSCVDSEDVDSGRTVQTAVVIDPADFLGDVPCADVDGAARSYVATAIDLETQGRIGPSSPVSCGTPIAFHAIEIDHRYGAEVSVFDAPPEAANLSAPTWTTTCGLSGSGAASVIPGRLTRIRGCTPLAGPGTATTSISVDASAVAGTVGCASTGGPIETIRVVPADASLPPVTLACGQPAVVYGADIVPGETYAFQLEGADAAGDVRWGAGCTAVAREGLSIPATCEDLTEEGDLEFPIPLAAAALGVTCGVEVTRAKVALPIGAETVPATVVGCDAPAFARGLLPGPYLGTIDFYAGAELYAAFSCTGEVLPGASSLLVCTLED